MSRTGSQCKPRNSSRCWPDNGSPDACRQQAQPKSSCQEGMPRMQNQKLHAQTSHSRQAHWYKPHDRLSMTDIGRRCCDCC